MGAARGIWDASKHPRDHGKFARTVVDVSERRNTGIRGESAFHPPLSATQRRSLKEKAPASWRTAKAIYDKHERGRPLTWREEEHISWASPSKIMEQRRKTGDAIIPRSEALARFRSYAPARSGEGRLGSRDLIVRNRRTGKLEAKRSGRDVELSGGRIVSAKRAHRAFDLPSKQSAVATAKPAVKPPAKPVPAYNPVLSTDAHLREVARAMGLEIPKRAGRNQLLKLIQGAS